MQHLQRRDRGQVKVTKFGWLFILWGVVCTALSVGAIWVIAHFIRKLW